MADVCAGDEGELGGTAEVAAAAGGWAKPGTVGGMIGGADGVAIPANALPAGGWGIGVEGIGLGDGVPEMGVADRPAAGETGVDVTSVVPPPPCPEADATCPAPTGGDDDDERRNAMKRPIGKKTVMITSAPANNSLLSTSGAGFFSGGFGRRNGFVAAGLSGDDAAGAEKTCRQ